MTDTTVSGQVRIASDLATDPQTFALRTAMGTVRIVWQVLVPWVDALVPAEIRCESENDTTGRATVGGAGLLGADVWIHRPNGPPVPWLAIVVETQAEHGLGVMSSEVGQSADGR